MPTSQTTEVSSQHPYKQQLTTSIARQLRVVGSPGIPASDLNWSRPMAITNETQPMRCSNCGADSTTRGDQPSVIIASVCPECGCTLSDSDETHEKRGFLTRLGRFGLGVKHRPLFQDHRKEPPQ